MKRKGMGHTNMGTLDGQRAGTIGAVLGRRHSTMHDTRLIQCVYTGITVHELHEAIQCHKHAWADY